MKTMKSLFNIFLLIALVSVLDFEIYAQSDVIRSTIGEKSSLAEIIDWMDKTSFAQARVGVVSEEHDSDGITDSPYESAFFSQGFKLTKVEKDCQLTLRNEQSIFLTGGVEYSYTFTDSAKALNNFIANARSSRTPYPIEIFINLKRLGPKKGKKPYLSAKNPEDAKLFGTWTTDFRASGINAIRADIFYADRKERQNYIGNDELMFTFESQEIAEKFDKSFRQAIRLCRAK